MRVLCLFVCLVGAVCVGWAQTYTGGTYRPALSDFPRWEVTAGWEGNSGALTLLASDRSTRGAHGVFARVLYYPARYVGVGVAGTYFASQSFSPLVDKYQSFRMGVVAKVHLSPNTNPRLYLLGGAGQRYHRLSYVAPFDNSRDRKQIFYLSGGLGIETDIYKNMFLALEGEFYYNTHTQVAKWFALKDRWDTSLRINAGVRF